MLALKKPQSHSYDSDDEVMGHGVGILLAAAVVGVEGFDYLNSKGVWTNTQVVDVIKHNNVIKEQTTTFYKHCATDFWATECDIGTPDIKTGSIKETFG